MADLDLTSEIRELRSTFGDIRHVVDEPKLILEVEELKEQAADPNLWDDTARAQSVTSKLSHKQAQEKQPLLVCQFYSWSMKTTLTHKQLFYRQQEN